MQVFNSFSELANAYQAPSPRVSTRTENGVVESIVQKYGLKLFEQTTKGEIRTRGATIPNLLQKIKEKTKADGVEMTPLDERDKQAIIDLYNQVLMYYRNVFSKEQIGDIERYRGQVALLEAQQLLDLGFIVPKSQFNPEEYEEHSYTDIRPGSPTLRPEILGISPPYDNLLKLAQAEKKSEEKAETAAEEAKRQIRRTIETLPTWDAQILAEDPVRLKSLKSDLLLIGEKADEAADQYSVLTQKAARVEKILSSCRLMLMVMPTSTDAHSNCNKNRRTAHRISAERISPCLC